MSEIVAEKGRPRRLLESSPGRPRCLGESSLARNDCRPIGLRLVRNQLKSRLKHDLNYESESVPEKNNFVQETELLNELQSFFEWLPGKNHLYCLAHEHRMTFYHEKTNDDNNKKVNCSGCHKAIDHALYGCPECPKIRFHKSCAELPREIKKHPFHTQHSLVHNPATSSDHTRKCSGCDLPLGNLPLGIYGCNDCNIFFHKFCLELPREIKHFHHPSHPLSLEQELEKSFKCNVCSADHTGLNYSCKRCDCNIGIRCIGREAPKRDGNPKGHILTFFTKQPSEHRDSVCLYCGKRFHLGRKRFHSRPVFHCKECKFSLHGDCVLPLALPLLPDTFASKNHGHRLTLTSYFDPDFNSTWQVCDVCEQLIPPDSLFYYCKDCIFAEDWTCVLSEKCWSFAHKKVDHVELDIVPILTDNPPSTVKEIIESFTPEDMKQLNALIKLDHQDDGDQLDQQDDRNKLDQPSRQILQVFESKFGEKRFGLSYCQTRVQVTTVKRLNFKIPRNLVPICNVLVEPEKKYLNRKDEIESPERKTFIFTILCAAMYSLWTVAPEEVTADQLFTYWDCFQIAKKAGFEIQIAFDRLSKAMQAYLGLADTNCSVPNQDFDEEMKKIRSEMEKLQITRTQRKASMLVGYKDHGSKDSIEIERVGENSWNESREITSDIFDSIEMEIVGENSWNEFKDKEVTSEEEEEEGEEAEDEEEVGENLVDDSSEVRSEEVGENLLDESSEVGSEEEEDPSSSTMQDTPGEVSEQEDDIANPRDRQESPSNLLKSDTKVGKEKSREMPETGSELPNPWDYGKDAKLKDPAERIRDFNKRRRSKSLSLCSHRLTSNGKISNKDGVKDEKNLCIACELPILEGKTTFKYCSKCNIFLHQFCDKYPPEIRHPLHLLHPLKLKVDREKKEIKCNVCEEKCRGCAYYWCEECNFYLEAQCLFQEPMVQSKCHGKVFRLPLKQYINQNPRGCFACGKKIVPGFSSDFLRCAPCNVSLHVKCPIPSRIIRSFHPHPLYFIRYSCGSQCDLCEKEMEQSLRPSYACQVCDKYFHIECATSNIM